MVLHMVYCTEDKGVSLALWQTGYLAEGWMIAVVSVLSQWKDRQCLAVAIWDCPGLYDPSRKREKVSVDIIQTLASLHPGPHAFLFVIRAGRYTEEEAAAYTRMKALFDENIKKYIIVVFTGGDDLEKEGKSMEDLLQSAPKALTELLEECNQRYVVFNNNAREEDKDAQVGVLLDIIRRMKQTNRDPYTCPKYAHVGQSLEAEVARRLQAAVEKRDLEERKIIQELEAEIEKTESIIRRLKEECSAQEDELKRRLQEENNREKEEEEKIKKLEGRNREKEEFKAQVGKEKQEREKQLEKLQQQQKENLKEIKIQEEKERKLEEEKREQENRRLDDEMNRMVDGVVRGQESYWVNSEVSQIVRFSSDAGDSSRSLRQ
ncbi:GTPase IMAP family member 9-like [Littorina saxatilis]|uniref:GTPase IMAP family member 9-like n=1 Tax=Littorina saxatilis TaxID=31220 RepID=UPI0038B43E4F